MGLDWRRWIPVFAWVALIFVFSTDSFSAEHTAGFILRALKFLFPFMAEGQLLFWHVVCRKVAHVTEYFVLGTLVLRALRGVSWGKATIATVALTFVLTIALTDEFHQSFVPSRTAALADVGYDFAGGVIALILLLVFRRELRPVHTHSVL